jgi:putative pyrroloquinoline-quinone binding quinoprotein
MDPFRNELEAAHRRIEQLERELAEARGETKTKTPAPAPSPTPTPIATRSRVRARFKVLGAVAAVAVAAYYAYPFVFSGEWEGVHAAILADVNGDGVPDVVGRIRHQERDRVTITASDGKNGRRLWESESLGPYGDTYQGVLGLAGDTLLFATPAAELRAFALRDGKKRWQSKLPEKAKLFCTGAGPSDVRIRLADDRIVSVGLGDGRSAGPSSDPLVACDQLADDGRETAVRFFVGHSSPSDYKVEGMYVSYALQPPDGPTVLFGYREKGTEVPMIAALYEDVSRNWKSDLPAEDPLQTSAESSQLAAVNATRAFATYQRSHSDDPHVLVCFDLAGRRQWEKALPDDQPLTAVQATEERVFVSQWGHLTVYDAKTGKTLFDIGG